MRMPIGRLSADSRLSRGRRSSIRRPWQSSGPDRGGEDEEDRGSSFCYLGEGRTGAKKKQVIVDITSQPKDITYPTDADLLYKARKKIIEIVERVREEETVRKSFWTFSRIRKRTLITVKKFCR
jgi:hypothetical protein